MNESPFSMECNQFSPKAVIHRPQLASCNFIDRMRWTPPFLIPFLCSMASVNGQSFLNPSLEDWGDPTFCNVNLAPDGWDGFSNAGQNFDEANFALCPTTIPSAASDGMAYGRAYVEDLNAGEGIAQTVGGFIPGNAYEVSFEYAGSNLFPGTNEVLWQIHLDGQLVDATDAVSSNEATWQPYTFTFTATSATHTLGFRAVTANNTSSGSAGIDNFALTALPSDVEDPVAGFGQNQAEICVNECIVFTNSSQFEEEVTWFFEGGNPAESGASDAVTVCYTEPGVFSVGLVATNAAGSDEHLIADAVTVFASPSGNLQHLGDSLLLETDGTESSVEWAHNGLPMAQDTYVISPVPPGLYEVTLNSGSGCTALLSQVIEDASTDPNDPTIEPGAPADDSPIFIPNAITLDENGLNDAWITYGDKANWAEFHALIFNRWGEVIFETHDPYRYWMGDAKDGAYYVQDGVYNYIVRVRLSDEAVARQFRGHVVVIR